MRAKERKEMEEKLLDSKVSIYRAMKVAIRSIPITNKLDTLDLDKLSEEMVEEAEALQQLRGITFNVIAKALGLVYRHEMSVSDYISLGLSFGQIKDALKNLDEDDYPTLLQLIDNAMMISGRESGSMVEQLGWNDATEHLALFVLLDPIKTLPETFSLYEISKVKPDEIEPSEVRIAAMLVQSIAYMKNDWPYLAEYAADQAAVLLDEGKITFKYEPLQLLGDAQGQEAQAAQWHAISVLLRGIARYRMDDEDKQELAFSDLELFLKDAEKVGAQNELVWAIGSIVFIKKEEHDKAAEYLGKLQASPVVGSEEKQLMSKVKEYVDARDPDKALTSLMDKMFISRLLVAYSYDCIKKTEWHQRATNSETGRIFLRFPGLLEEEYSKIEAYMDVKGAFDKLFGSNED